MTANLSSERVRIPFRVPELALRCRVLAGIVWVSILICACGDGLGPSASLTWMRVPSGTSEPLYDVWGSAPGDVWAVGFNGTILHYDGTRWQRALEGVSHLFRGVWGSGRTNVWAVGIRGLGDPRPVLYHYDGQAWRPTPSVADALAHAPLTDVWGTSASNVWAVGYGGVIIHFNGTAWNNQSMIGDLYPEYIWGSPAGDAWITGGRALLRFNGQSWAPHSSPLTDSLQLTAGWGIAPTDHWAGTVTGPLLHFDGVTWTRTVVSTLAPAQRVHGMWGEGGAIWAVVRGGIRGPGIVLNYDGARWSEVARDSMNMYGVWGSSRRDVWAVGEAGVILHGTSRR